MNFQETGWLQRGIEGIVQTHLCAFGLFFVIRFPHSAILISSDSNERESNRLEFSFEARNASAFAPVIACGRIAEF